MEVYQGGKNGQTFKVPQLPKGSIRKALIGILILVVVLLAFSSFYMVQEHEHAAILTFGKYTETQTNPGLHFKLPYPIQKVIIVPAELQQKIQIGYREDAQGRMTIIEEEALMITGDENIVHADAVVEWRVADLQNFLFNIEDPEHFLRNAASSSIRTVIGSTRLDYAITEGKTVIQEQVKEKLIELMQMYNTGIQIDDVKFQDIEPPEGEVQQAFKEVTNAREEKNTKINRAQKYVNDVLPKARGEAQALLERAEAEKRARILSAEGDVAKFNAIYNEYVNNPEVTGRRLVLETIEKILPNAKIIITDGNGSTIQYLPLNELMKSSTGRTGSNTPQPSPSPSPAQGGDAQ